MIDFLLWCMFIAFCLTIGGFLLNLLFILVITIFGLIWGGVEAICEWIGSKLNKDLTE